MLIRFASLVLISVLAVSCNPAGNVDYSGIQSVGFSSGMGNKMKRVRIGTTVFNNSSETVTVQDISPKVAAAAVGILEGRVNRVVTLDVPTSPSKSGWGGQRSPVIDTEEFREKSIAAAKAKGLDAVWICFPAQLTGAYGARGMGTTGYEHRQDSFMGMDRDSVHFSAILELIDVRTGKTLRTNPTTILGEKEVESEDWQEEWSSVSASRRKTITGGITQAAEVALGYILD